MGVITLDDLKLYLNSPKTETGKDAILQQIVGAANKAVESHCNRIFDETKLENEEYDGTDSTVLYLKRTPITSVQLLRYGYPPTIALVTVDTSWYGIGADYIYTDGRSGMVFDLRPKYWKVSYTGGYKQTQMPADLVLAVCELGALFYKDQEKRLGITSDSVGGEVTTAYTKELTANSKRILDSYKRVAV